MNAQLINYFKKRNPDVEVSKVFDVGSELLIKTNVRMDPYYFINKESKKIRGAKIPEDLPTIEKAFTSGNELSIKKG